MDENKRAVIRMRLERTAKALRKNGFGAQVAETREDLLRLAKQELHPGDCCTVGGSVTLSETGLLDYLRQGDFEYLDRYAPDAVKEEVYRRAFSCDVYLTSSNAVIEDGRLYNIDGWGNRVAAMIYGPKKVLVVAGYNKLVPDLEAARERKNTIAAPANAQRLNKQELPCYHTGRCGDCSSPGRFCCAEVIQHRSMIPERIVVLLSAEELGY